MELNIKQLFGRNLKRIRINRGYTQRKLADTCQVASKSIHLIEAGHTFPHVSTMEKLCKTLEISPAELFVKGNELVDMDDIGNFIEENLNVSMKSEINYIVNDIKKYFIGARRRKK